MPEALQHSIAPEIIEQLLDVARKAATTAYAPYSKFHVGAALLMQSGAIITGCNVENASFGMTICAERTAITSAVHQGHRDWKALAIVSPTGVSPCGACRQVLAEFAIELPVWFGHLDPDQPTIGPVRVHELLPYAMKL
jgi:cytidine deaminase